MGITSSDIDLINRAFTAKTIKSVGEYGSQNVYTEYHEKPPFANSVYLTRGVDIYDCFDLSGDNNSINANLAHPYESERKYDLVTDFGCSEHYVQSDDYDRVEFHDGHIHSVYPSKPPTEMEISLGYYYAWKNKHDMLKVEGLMINVNPKTGNWPGHGYTYINKFFYYKLATLMGYTLLYLEETAAMGNTTDGLNICCILQKMDDREFISFDDFQNCDQFPS